MKKLFWNEYISIGAMVIGIASLILSMVVPGPQGPAGISGSNGVNGSNGIDGVDGSDGVNGVDGSNGIDGQDGADGESVEFQIIDGLMMYRLGNDGDWQYYQTAGSKDYRYGLDEGVLEWETDFLLDYEGIGELVARDMHLFFQEIIDQNDYVEFLTDIGYTPVATVQDFLDINLDLTGNYVLVNDIDFNDAVYLEPLIGEYGETTEGFEGIFDGAGFALQNLSLQGDNLVHGIFAAVSYGGLLGNLRLENITMNNINDLGFPVGYGLLAGIVEGQGGFENIEIIDSSISDVSHAGFLFGKYRSPDGFNSDIQSLSINVSVRNSSFTGDNEISEDFGGLVGTLLGGRHGFYQNTLENVSLQSFKENVGGLVGAIRNEAFVQMFSNTLNSVSIISQGNQAQFVGGLLGTSENELFLSLINNTIESLLIDIPQGQYLGGLIGVTMTQGTLDIIQNDIQQVIIQGQAALGGILGGTLEEADFGVFTSFMANDVIALFLGQEKVGGLAGHFANGFAMVTHNYLDTTFIEGESDLGGLIGYLHESTLTVWNNVFMTRMELLIDVQETNFRGLMGGVFGNVNTATLIQMVNNFIQTSISFVLNVVTDIDWNEGSIFLYAVGGVIGYAGVGNQLILIDSIVGFYVEVYINYSGAPVDFEMGHTVSSFGGVIGNFNGAFSTLYMENNYVSTTVILELISPLPILFLTVNSLGGVIGEGTDGDLIMQSNRMSFSLDLEFGSSESDPTAYEAEQLFLTVRYVGGLIGLSQYMYIQVERLDLEFFLGIYGSLPLIILDDILVMRFSEMGGFFGFMEASIVEIIEFTLDMSITMDDVLYESLVSLAENNPMITGLEFSHTASLFGLYLGEPFFGGMLINQGLIRMVVDNKFITDEGPFYFGLFAVAGSNQSLTAYMVGADVTVFSNARDDYDFGFYPLELAHRVENEVAWEAALLEFLDAHPLWIDNEQGLFLFLPGLILIP